MREAYVGVEIKLHAFLDRVESASRSVRFTPHTYCIQSWWWHIGGVDVVAREKNYLPCRESNSRSAVLSRTLCWLSCHVRNMSRNVTCRYEDHESRNSLSDIWLWAGRQRFDSRKRQSLLFDAVFRPALGLIQPR